MTKVVNVLLEHSRERIVMDSNHIVFSGGTMLYFSERYHTLGELMKFIQLNDQCVLNIFQPETRIADTEVYCRIQESFLGRKPTSSVVVESYIINLKSPFTGLKYALYNSFPLVVNVFVNYNQRNAVLLLMKRTSCLLAGEHSLAALSHTADTYFCRKFYQILVEKRAFSLNTNYCQHGEGGFRRARSYSKIDEYSLPTLIPKYVLFDAFRQRLLDKLSNSYDEPFSVQIALYLTTKENIGAYHTGVVLLGCELAYGGTRIDTTGIYMSKPGENSRFYFQRFLEIGLCTLEFQRAADIICSLSENWRGRDYDIVRHNCNDFSSVLCELLCEQTIPAFINRLAKFGRKFV